ncbi:ARM repeat CCCH-type zinc finger protein [Medicago truncatula]|uniref:ARM repeat CCCH-type zinc finger protein n=2 Tax=Medicago truncatula TaxID=3880 RepID=A0A072UW95_MEDTR|nr:ARM repeat CCCH-type zinc finger protein [Medicago truncatula]
MCGGPEKSKSLSDNVEDMKNLTVTTNDSLSSLLEHASKNDFEQFKIALDSDASLLLEVGAWCVRQNGHNQIVLEDRTALMVAASCGSIDILKLILSCSEAGVNFTCGTDKTTALHCAASSGTVNAVDAVKLLLSAGADIYCVDANGNRPMDVIVLPIVVPHKLEVVKRSLEQLLSNSAADESVDDGSLPLSSFEKGSPSSPVAPKLTDTAVSSTPEKKKYPIDPSIPDIRNSIYATDEFRMYSVKVLLCHRAYTHNWTECPFYHPNENARRRDPRKFTYSCVPCADFKTRDCKRGDMCEYAHGVFETWLHPDQYRTRLCKEGTNCNRKVCFFAHVAEELRPSHASIRSAASAPIVMDMAASTSLYRGSLSAISSMYPPPFAQPLSPYANGLFDGQQHMLNDLSCFSQPCPGTISLGRSVNSWSKWGSRTGKPDWSVNGNDFGRSLRYTTFEHGNNVEEPDISWVQSLVN